MNNENFEIGERAWVVRLGSEKRPCIAEETVCKIASYKIIPRPGVQIAVYFFSDHPDSGIAASRVYKKKINALLALHTILLAEMRDISSRLEECCSDIQDEVVTWDISCST